MVCSFQRVGVILPVQCPIVLILADTGGTMETCAPTPNGWAPTRLPGRVLLPVQPSPFTQPRTGLPASTPTRRRSRPGPLPAADKTTPATQGAATSARSDRAPAQHRPPPRDPPLATL